jgi:hypothetical protein
VEEYQVLVSPYDVRYGDFAGALVNAVTKHGTNDLHGNAFLYFRNEALARDDARLRAAPYDRTQLGVTFGGPIVRDLVHFFVASEFQRLTAPASGPYVGSAAPLPVDTADIARFVRLLHDYGLEGGSAGPVRTGTPLTNVFGRVDVSLPRWNSRFVLRHNYGSTEDARFSRPTADALYPLSSYGYTAGSRKNATVAQVLTTFRSGAFNELIAGRTTLPTVFSPNAHGPIVSVAVPDARLPGGTAVLRAGSFEFAQGGALQQRSIEITDDLTLPVGARHRLTAGARAEFFRMRRDAVYGAYGAWGFASLNALASGVADSFRVVRAVSPAPTLEGGQYSLYAGDRWQVGRRVAIDAGMRADVEAIRGRPPFNPEVDTVFGLRTDVAPPPTITWSPRVGFAWDVAGDERGRLRGGAGVFAGRAPLGWLFNAFESYGGGMKTLRCGSSAAASGPAPRFDPDYRSPPTACANGAGLGQVAGAVDLLSREVRLARTLKGTLAFDRRLPGRTEATVEGVYTKSLSGFLFVNRNLPEPVGVDRFGRVMYGRIGTNGVAAAGSLSRFSEVIELRRLSRDYAYELGVQLRRRVSEGVEATLAYTFSRTRDVQTQLNPLAFDNWRFGRAVSGRHDDLRVGVSDYDVPHRIVLAGTYVAPWRRWSTDASLYYVGTSGAPFTYVAAAEQGKGDLNADGTNVNDPIYVPRSTVDTSEIRFAGAPVEILVQQQAFEAFIAGAACLRRQRGRIMERNSCRAPWVHTANAALRQSVLGAQGRTLSLELQVFNVLDLLGYRWGAYQVPTRLVRQPSVSVSGTSALLRHVGQTPPSINASQPIFRFDATRRFEPSIPESSYQLQLGARYRF